MSGPRARSAAVAADPPVRRRPVDRQSRCLICWHPIRARSSAAVAVALTDHWRIVHPEAWTAADPHTLGIIWGA